MSRYGWILLLLGLAALTLSACQPVAAGAQAQSADAECSVQGAWIGSFTGGAYDMPLIFQSTITAQDTSEDKLTYVMRWVNGDVTFKNPQLEETDYVSELVGEAIRTGPNTYDFSVIGYGVKERPGERNGITYILEVSGSLACDDGNNISSDVNVSVYLGEQDADQDAFPDEGEKPFLCIGPIGFGTARRAPILPRCEADVTQSSESNHSSGSDQIGDLTLVQISVGFSMSPQEYLDTVQQVAGAIAEQPGLVWKIWPFDEAARQGGGVCLFESREDAMNYLEGPIIQEFSVLPGIEDIEVTVSGVAAELSAITHAQLTRDTEPPR